MNYIPEWSIGAISVPDTLALTGAIEITSPGSQINGVNFQLDSGATVQGTVYHNAEVSAPACNVIVKGSTAEDACAATYETITNQYTVAVQEGDSYAVTGLRPGTYYVEVYHSGDTDEWLAGINTDSSPDCLLAEKLTVTSEEPEQVFEQRNFQIGTGGNISGTVFQPGGQTPVDDVYVVRFHASCATEGDEAEAMTASGKYTSPVLPAGDYYLALLDEDKSELIGWRTVSGSPADSCADSAPVHVEEDVTTSGINFILKSEVNLIPIYFLLLGK